MSLLQLRSVYKMIETENTLSKKAFFLKEKPVYFCKYKYTKDK